MHFQDELTIDMTHFSGEGWGITEEEIDACKERIREAALSVEREGAGRQSRAFPASAVSSGGRDPDLQRGEGEAACSLEAGEGAGYRGVDRYRGLVSWKSGAF